jgi:putative hydrolase of the HAD superfamily
VSKRASGDLISTMFIDADGVMQSTDDGWHDALVSLLGDRGEADGERFISAIQHAERPTMDGRTDIDEAMRRVLDEFSVVADVEDILDVWTKIQPHEDMVKAVLDLRSRGIQCVLTTNQQSRRARWMRENLHYDEVFDEQFYSCELGLAKPDPAYFSTILDRLDLDPATVLFVDDTEVNVVGARETGIHAELFPRHGGEPALAEILTGYVLVGERAA